MSKLKHHGLRTSWWIIRLVRKVADWMDDLHSYLLRAMFDNCADCGMEDGYGHRNGCQFGRRFTTHTGRVTKVSKRPPLVLEDEA